MESKGSFGSLTFPPLKKTQIVFYILIFFSFFLNVSDGETAYSYQNK